MLNQIKNYPRHVAIILDGNRRFAKRLMLEPWKGHEYGRDKVKDLIRYAKNFGVNELTFYALSLENIKSRPKNELDFLYKIFKEVFSNMDAKEVKDNKIRFKFIGELNLLPKDLRNECKKLEKETQKNSGLIVNIAIAYGGRQEIIEAVKKILKNKIKPKDLNEKIFEENLLLKDSPDLIIRTGGEKRTSNFLPWQSAYSELIFMDKMWPEFEKEDFQKCLEEFRNRKRNFGA
jgi:tritrans,polycis-undecaprenyl-diphosphate synthase [geranylgeranyl-diphosphate specific]